MAGSLIMVKSLRKSMTTNYQIGSNSSEILIKIQDFFQENGIENRLQDVLQCVTNTKQWACSL